MEMMNQKTMKWKRPLIIVSEHDSMYHSKFIHSMTIWLLFYLYYCRALYGQLIGSKGSIKQRLEIETKTIVKIPKPGGSTDIIIIGAARQNVVTARRRMEVMVLAARNKHPFTHFLSVPIYSSDIRDTFVKFKVNIVRIYLLKSTQVLSIIERGIR